VNNQTNELRVAPSHPHHLRHPRLGGSLVVSRRGAADQAERLLRSARVRHLQSPGHFGEMQRRLVVPAGATEPTVLQSQRRSTRAKQSL
jgi:hypothetical protein